MNSCYLRMTAKDEEFIKFLFVDENLLIRPKTRFSGLKNVSVKRTASNCFAKQPIFYRLSYF